MIFDTQTQLTLYLIRHGESFMNKDHKDLIGGGLAKQSYP